MANRPVSPHLGAATALCALAWASGCEMQSPPDLRRGSLPTGGGTLVVDLADGMSLDAARELTGLDLEWVHPNTADEALAIVNVADVAATARALNGLEGVEAAEPSLTYSALGFTPNDPLYARQWNLHLIGAPTAADAGHGVVVAVIDTGLTRVPDLEAAHILDGVSFVTGVDSVRDGNGHGTHVAGTIAQVTNNGVGVAGVAPGATLLPLKALDDNGAGQSEWVAAAIDEAADQGAEVINMSLGGPPSRIIEVAVQKAQARGVLVVAAAGNAAVPEVSSPARLDDVIAVSATGPTDAIAPYSSWGEQVAIAAPGGDKKALGGGILQDTVVRGGGHDYLEYQGTSMATPHVAGAAAVLLAAGASGPADVRKLLQAGAVDLGAPGHDPVFGAGRLDVAASLRALRLHRSGVLFTLGALLAFGVARFGGLRSGRGIVGLAGGLAAGGAFFLPELGLSGGRLGALAALPPLTWADQLLPHPWGQNPLLISALLPAILTFLLGPMRGVGVLVAGACAGFAAHLAHGAITGSLAVWPLSPITSAAWLGINALACLLCAVAVFGLQRSLQEKT